MRNKADAPPRSGQFGPGVYAAWRVSSLGEITEALEHRVILRLAGPLQGRSVLDVGCGDGTLALVLARNGAACVSGCDPDPRMVARAMAQAARCDPRIDLAVARSQALPFPDNRFDVVTCITVLASNSRIVPPGRTTRRSSRNAGICWLSASTQNRNVDTAASKHAAGKSRLTTSISRNSIEAAECVRRRSA
jgi:SAM-dependent methyltransferase